MHVRISQKFHPFSHLPGIFCLIPQTTWEAEIFPTLIRLSDLSLKNREKKEIPLAIKGPVKDFTVQLDLGKKEVRVFGFSPDGYFHYRIYLNDKSNILLVFDKGKKEEKTLLHAVQSISPHSNEKLSLGMHKSQDWEMVMRRMDLREIFPICLKLSELTPLAALPEKIIGTLHLTEACKRVVEKRDKIKVIETFRTLFQTAFRGILSPRLSDDRFLGVISYENVEDLSPLPILHEAAKWTKALFFQDTQDQISILPCVPSQFHAGRFTDLALGEDLIDIEWSKGLLKKLIWRCNQERKVSLDLQKPIKRFRFRSSIKERGAIIPSTQEIFLQPRTYYFDRFEK
ncbi:MAG: hypothetical protein L0207_04365 [Chlamydiae bacterium]|nr:hypothetical protein [Chlamydiota bacterium]